MRIAIASILATALLAFPAIAHSKTLKIAVIDTGIDGILPHLCKAGHKSFVGVGIRTPDGVLERNPLIDRHGHGTHVAGLIEKYAEDGDYCLVALKYYSDNNPGQVNLANEKKALRRAIDLKVDYINMSGGGPMKDIEEEALIKEALDNGIVFVASAGNGDDMGIGQRLSDESCQYFPACLDSRIVVVGNSDGKYATETLKARSSNYGPKVTRWEIGTNVESTLPGGRTGKMTGTSQAAAIATGKLVKAQLSINRGLNGSVE